MREVVQFSFEQIFVLINRVCFEHGLKQYYSADYKKLKMQNEDYCGNMLYLAALLLRMFRSTDIKLFDEAASFLVFKNQILFTKCQQNDTNTPVEQKTVIQAPELYYYEYNFQQNSVQQLQFPQPLTIALYLLKLKPSPAHLLIINSLLNIGI